MKFYLLFVVLLASQAWAAKQENEADNSVEEVEEDQQEEVQQSRENPCNGFECTDGEECKLTEDKEPECVCIQSCPEITDKNFKVCSSLNVTFDSECEMIRQKCLCRNGDDACQNPDFASMLLDRYGECQEEKECTEEELNEFPLRMRSWLFSVMEELKSRNALSKPEKKIVKKAEKQEKNYVLPTFWKFCDLDKSHDMYVDLEELIPITAPLKRVEHCTGPFIEGCDQNNDGYIYANEWKKCLLLEDGDDVTDDIEEICKSLKD